MDPLGWVKFGLAFAALYAVTALSYLLWRTSRTSRKLNYAQAAGSETRGIIYAFGRGMSPTAKDSVRRHLPTFVAGALYHLAIFSAAAFTIVTLFSDATSPVIIVILSLLIGIGFIAGLGLVLKRAALRKMRVISTPDDYIANLLVDAFLFTTLIATFYANWITPLYLTAIVLLVYLPIGKIRHCVFFFYTRIQFGRLFGRRGVLPYPAGEER